MPNGAKTRSRQNALSVRFERDSYRQPCVSGLLSLYACVCRAVQERDGQKKGREEERKKGRKEEKEKRKEERKRKREREEGSLGGGGGANLFGQVVVEVLALVQREK